MESTKAADPAGAGKNLVEIRIDSSKMPPPQQLTTSQSFSGTREAPPERPARLQSVKQQQQAKDLTGAMREVPTIITTPNSVSSPAAPATAPAVDTPSNHHHHLHSVHLPLSATASLSNTSGNVNSSFVTDRSGGVTFLTKSVSRSADPSCIPTPTKRNANKLNAKGRKHRVLSVLDRRCPHHSFMTEVTDVQQMEQGLVQLLDDFHEGKLQAFGKDCSFEKMDNVRERQERLARLHFDLGSQQENYGTLSEDGRTIAKEHLTKLMTQLQELSLAIEQLQSSTSGTNLQTEV